MSGFPDRENQLFAILETFSAEGLEFLVIGGYAVAAYQHRFSVDADLVITAEQFERFATLLREEGYKKIKDRKLDAGRFVAFQRSDDLPVTVDLMVGGVQSRATNASWDYDELVQQADQATVKGSERSVTVRIPEKELLLAMKLHSGRMTDARDMIALADDIDFDRVAAYADRGDTEQFKAVLEELRDTIKSEDFADAYKGVFTAQTLPEDRIAAVDKFLEQQVETLDTD